jgi:5-carboxymethyl-2-hydroxymuconate isomerase
MPNYYNEALAAFADNIKSRQTAVENLVAINKEHEAEILARKKAIDLNHEIIDLHIATNEKVNEIIGRYKEPEAEIG